MLSFSLRFAFANFFILTISFSLGGFPFANCIIAQWGLNVNPLFVFFLINFNVDCATARITLEASFFGDCSHCCVDGKSIVAAVSVGKETFFVLFHYIGNQSVFYEVNHCGVVEVIHNFFSFSFGVFPFANCIIADVLLFVNHHFRIFLSYFFNNLSLNFYFNALIR
jgi:hypothetical protein